MVKVTKPFCVLLIAALIVQFSGCASTSQPPLLTEVPAVSNSDISLRRYTGEGIELASGEALIFGRLKITDAKRFQSLDLGFDAAMFLASPNAPHKPIPRWSKTELHKAAGPFESNQRGLFAVIAPVGVYHLHVVYRSFEAGWIAIDPAVQIQTTEAGAATYVGELQIEIDPEVIAKAKAKASGQTGEAIRMDRSDSYEVDYAALLQTYPNAGKFPVRQRLMGADSTARPSAIVSTAAPPAGSEKLSVSKVISNTALVMLGIVLFPIVVVLAILSTFRVH
jgi:hypothetical protein